jgi:hypothetical protein
MKRSSRLGYFAALVFILASSSSTASEPAAAPPPKPKKTEPSGLTGNKLPQCPDGQYVAAMICKVAAPGFYLEYGMKYPAQCPEGMTSPAGAKSKAYCYKKS